MASPGPLDFFATKLTGPVIELSGDRTHSTTLHAGLVINKLFLTRLVKRTSSYVLERMIVALLDGSASARRARLGTPCSSESRAICTGGLKHQDPLLRTKKKQGFSPDSFYGSARIRRDDVLIGIQFALPVPHFYSSLPSSGCGLAKWDPNAESL